MLVDGWKMKFDYEDERFEMVGGLSEEWGGLDLIDE